MSNKRKITIPIDHNYSSLIDITYSFVPSHSPKEDKAAYDKAFWGIFNSLDEMAVRSCLYSKIEVEYDEVESEYAECGHTLDNLNDSLQCMLCGEFN